MSIFVVIGRRPFSPRQPLLRRVWEKVIRQDGRYVSWEFANAGTGVATAIRVSDEAPLGSGQS